jgi:hypothetical protein
VEEREVDGRVDGYRPGDERVADRVIMELVRAGMKKLTKKEVKN